MLSPSRCSHPVRQLSLKTTQSVLLDSKDCVSGRVGQLIKSVVLSTFLGPRSRGSGKTQRAQQTAIIVAARDLAPMMLIKASDVIQGTVEPLALL